MRIVLGNDIIKVYNLEQIFPIFSGPNIVSYDIENKHYFYVTKIVIIGHLNAFKICVVFKFSETN